MNIEGPSFYVQTQSVVIESRCDAFVQQHLITRCDAFVQHSRQNNWEQPPLPPTSFVEAYLDPLLTRCSAVAFDPWSKHGFFDLGLNFIGFH